MLISSQRAGIWLVFACSVLGCASPPPSEVRLSAEDGKPFSDDENPSTRGSDGESAGTCEIFTCRYTAVGSPACADYYALDGWNAEDAEKDCKKAAAAVQTTTIDVAPQAPCIRVGAAEDGKIGGQCVIPGALSEFKSRTVYAYGMTEGLCTGIKDLEGRWQAEPIDPCPDVTDDASTKNPATGGKPTATHADVYSCRTSDLLGAKRCTDYPSVYGFDEATSKSKCEDAKGMFSADVADACIAGGFEKRCKLADTSYQYGVDSCDGLFGVLELLGAAQPPEKGPFPPYNAIACGERTQAKEVYTCRYEGFAPSCADYPAKEGWSEESAAAHCKTLPNSKDHKMGGRTCLAGKTTDTTRCRIEDEAVCGQVYYGYDIPDFVCTGGLIAGKTTYEKQPFEAAY